MGLRATQIWGLAGFLLMAITAIILGIMFGNWGRVWMWGSTVIFFVIWMVMGRWGRKAARLSPAYGFQAIITLQTGTSPVCIFF